MIQSFFLECAWLAGGVWLAIRPRDLVVLIERSNRSKWEHANLTVIRGIGLIWVVGILAIWLYRIGHS